jgi:hypothetical protein
MMCACAACRQCRSQVSTCVGRFRSHPGSLQLNFDSCMRSHTEALRRRWAECQYARRLGGRTHARSMGSSASPGWPRQRSRGRLVRGPSLISKPARVRRFVRARVWPSMPRLSFSLCQASPSQPTECIVYNFSTVLMAVTLSHQHHVAAFGSVAGAAQQANIPPPPPPPLRRLRPTDLLSLSPSCSPSSPSVLSSADSVGVVAVDVGRCHTLSPVSGLK